MRAHASATHLQFFDERQEKVPLQAILIQGIWGPVGGADQDQAVLPQPAEQPVQDCSISHIIHKELIQAQHLAFPGHRVGHLHQGILVAVVLLQAGVHVQHEVMEVCALQLQSQQQRVCVCLPNVDVHCAWSVPVGPFVQLPAWGRFFCDVTGTRLHVDVAM